MIEEYLKETNVVTKFRTRNYTKNSNNFLKYCTKCRKVWENSSRTGGSITKVVYYDDFPTIGKDRKTCEKCK